MEIMENYDLVVIGGGPAGLAAAYAAKKNGIDKILILERENELGGILNQCIHNGFGLHYFKEELTGPEYAQKFIDLIKQNNIEVKLNSMVTYLSDDKIVHFISKEYGYNIVKSKSVVLAMGCRERTRGAISIPGDRPSGVLTAGTAQLYVNMYGLMCGKKVVILGSGDIGLIMARRMALEGAEVLACVEIMPHSNGLARNIVQCLNDYNIPLLLSHTVTKIIGKERLEKIVISKVDENWKPIVGTEIEIECDTLLLSIGLIPENEITKQAGVKLDQRTKGAFVYENMETSVEGIFSCGNVCHVHDLVDYVTEEATKAGISASEYIKNIDKNSSNISFNEKEIISGNGIIYTVPQKIRSDKINNNLDILFRVNKIYDNINIIITDEMNNLIKKYRKSHVAPAEMEKIRLEKRYIDKICGDKIFISVEKEIN